MSNLTAALNPEPSTMQASRLAGWREQEMAQCRHRWCQLACDGSVVCMVCGIEQVQP